MTEWHRLHPLSPLIRAGPGIAGLLGVVVARGASQAGGQTGNFVGDVVAIVLVLAGGVVSWLVTRWRVEDGVLRIDGGLVRRTSKRFPLTQLQAVDTIRPLLARVLGLTELRLRMAGSSGGSGRLAYLPDAEADVLRSRLMALAHGVAEHTPAPPERRLIVLSTPLLFASLLLSGLGAFTLILVGALLILTAINPSIAAAAVGGSATVLLGLATTLWRRFNSGYNLTVAEAADGLRLRAGLLQTAAETIPRGRVQAVRMIQPLLWRPLGWCRVEVDVAGKQRSKRENRSQSRSWRALLPVGDREQALWLIERVFPGVPAQRLRPPARARWKSPLRFSNLSWGCNEAYAVTTSGRLRRATDWVPLSKVQSIRRVEGPVQRRLALATIHLDTAGRNVHAVLRDRDRREADHLIAHLPASCREARRRDSGVR